RPPPRRSSGPGRLSREAHQQARLETAIHQHRADRPFRLEMARIASAGLPHSRNAHRMTNRRYCLITPCRDEADYARITLESITKQTIPPALWVIVDDGSTDNTPRI